MRMGKIDRSVILAALSQDKKVKQQMRRLAGQIRDEARTLAPVKSGDLRRSIKVYNYYDRGTRTVEYRIGWDRSIAFYGWMVEAGTEDTAAQPHLRPAAKRFGGVPPGGR